MMPPRLSYYPLLLDLRGKKCVVVGGGSVAQRKVKSLLKAKARVWVISPNLTEGLEQLKRKKSIFYIKAHYQKKYLKGAFLVIAATFDGKTNQAVADGAQTLDILTNVVDAPHLSSFIVPSSIHKGDLTISISTNGKAPGLSKRIRRDLQKLLLPDYAQFLKRLKDIRKDLQERCARPKLRRLLMHYLINA